MLFYLQSRGIPQAAARRLLTYAFAAEVHRGSGAGAGARGAGSPGAGAARTGQRDVKHGRTRCAEPWRAPEPTPPGVPPHAGPRGCPSRTVPHPRHAIRGSRSSTSTAPPPRRSRSAVIDAARALLCRGERQHPPRACYCAERRRDGDVRCGAGGRWRGSSAPPCPARSSSPAAPPRRSTSWRRAGAGRRCGRATRSWSPRWSTTRTSCPWQLLAAGDRRRGCAVAPVTDAGELDLDALDAPAHAAHPARGGDPPLQRARHHQPGARASPTWRMRRAPWCWWTARSRCPTARWTCATLGLRLLRLLRPQAVRPDRCRRAVRARGAARADAAVAGRRRHDRAGHARGHDLGRRCR